MQSPRRRFVPAVGVLLVTLLLSAGCGAHSEVPTRDLIGMTVAEANASVPDGRSYAWYDLSREVLGHPGTLIGGDRPNGAGGVVIAVCADAATLENSHRVTAGAIPMRDYDRAVRKKALSGGYREFLPECAGG
jgi:hypothetical protein